MGIEELLAFLLVYVAYPALCMAALWAFGLIG